MKKFFQILKFIFNHPLASQHFFYATGRFLRWQIAQKLFPNPVLYPFIENSKLLIEKGMTGATGNIYTGLLEFDDMAFVLHFLRSGDLFVDVGANVGVYSILAGANAESHVISIEPVPSTFEKLERNIFLNKLSGRVQLVQAGVGSKTGELLFTTNKDTVNHVLSPSENSLNNEVLKIPVYTLDEICDNQNPVLLKIDVEGFEQEVLNGAKKLLQTDSLKAIIIELNGSGERYGYKDIDIHNSLLAFGFGAYSYAPFERELTQLDKPGKYNTIYIRQQEPVIKRIESARKFQILKSLV